MNTIIQNLMDFMNPDVYVTPNVYSNILGLIVATGIVLGGFIKGFDTFIIREPLETPLKTKLYKRICLGLIYITLLFCFFPIYNVIRSMFNPNFVNFVFRLQ